MSIAEKKQQKLPDEELTLDNPWLRSDWWEELSLCKGQHLVQAVLQPASNTGKGHDRCEDQWGAAERRWVSPKARDTALPFLISRQSEDKPVFICQRKWNARVGPEDTQLHFRRSPLNTLQGFQLEAKITEIRKAQRERVWGFSLQRSLFYRDYRYGRPIESWITSFPVSPCS